jgi:hypothetical protein
MNAIHARGLAPGLIAVVVALLLSAASMPTGTDTVEIGRAEYDQATGILLVEATSSNAAATLKVYRTDTERCLGALVPNGDGTYADSFAIESNPERITVKSSLGGSAVSEVKPK